jgi:hypothetical protein
MVHLMLNSGITAGTRWIGRRTFMIGYGLMSTWSKLLPKCLRDADTTIVESGVVSREM